MTISEFAPLFSGKLAEHGALFVLAADTPASVPGSALVDRAFLSRQLSLFAETYYPGGDRRVVASLWSKTYFAAVIPPFMALMLVLQRAVPIDLGAIGCTFAPDGTIKHIHLANTGRACTAVDAESRFGNLTDNHFAPVIKALAAESRISARVLWSNAGNIFDIATRRGESFLGKTAAVEDAFRLMDLRHLHDGRTNPLYKPALYTDHQAGVERRRRVCCIRYLVDGLGYCSTCPLSADTPAADKGVN